MRYIICTIIALFSLSVSAQFAPLSYDGPDRLLISQIDNREYSTLVFFDYTVPTDSTWQQSHQWMNFADKTYISVPGETKKYKLLSTVNIPIDSEAEHKMMLFDRAGQRHRFVLEFEKLPSNCTSFNIIEKADNPNAFNFSNITINPNDTLSFVNVDAWIEDYPLKEYGQYYVNGTLVHYVKYNGIIVNAVPQFLDQYGKYVSVNISVQNFRDRAILFNPENLSATAIRHPKKKTKKIKTGKSDLEDDIYAERSVRRKKDSAEEYDMTISIPFEAELLSYEEYDRIVRKKQNWQSFWTALGEGLAASGAGYSTSTTNYSGHSSTSANAHAYGNVGGTYGYAHAYGSSYTTAYAQSTTTSYNGLAAYAANQQAAANMANLSYEQNQIRQQIGDGYVKKHTIPAETEYSGFFNIKYSKAMQGMTVTLVIDEDPYTFYF